MYDIDSQKLDKTLITVLLLITITLGKLFKICESYDKYEELRSWL